MGIPPTGSRVEIPAVAMVRVREGKIVEMRSHPDVAGIMMQLGLMSPS